jgi:hypothetical protein
LSATASSANTTACLARRGLAMLPAGLAPALGPAEVANIGNRPKHTLSRTIRLVPTNVRFLSGLPR